MLNRAVRQLSSAFHIKAKATKCVVSVVHMTQFCMLSVSSAVVQLITGIMRWDAIKPRSNPPTMIATGKADVNQPDT